MFNLFDKRIYPVLKNFPKSERYALAQEIKMNLEDYEKLSKIIKAQAELIESLLMKNLEQEAIINELLKNAEQMPP